jgi:hypothetical protein
MFLSLFEILLEAKTAITEKPPANYPAYFDGQIITQKLCFIEIPTVTGVVLNFLQS